jgi:SAM-dependent methyltransferase
VGEAQHAARTDDWDRHWDDYAAAAEHNPAQEYRRRLTLALLGQQLTPRRLLDIGSGQGDFLADAARRWPSAELRGLETSAVGVEKSQAKVPTARFEVRDLLDGSSPGADEARWATHAVCSEVLEHVDRPQELVRAARAYLAPGCRLVVTVPGGPMSAFDRHIGHRRHFSPTELKGLLKDAGMPVEYSTGAGFPFFNLYRGVVISRGERIAADFAASGPGVPDTRVARAAMTGFRVLFRLNLSRSRRGWQTIAVAREPQLPRLQPWSSFLA